MDVLDGWRRERFVHGGRARLLLRRGSGPQILLLHEVPGITPQVIDLAGELIDHGFSVAIPHLFGTPGAPRTRWRQGVALAEIAWSRQFIGLRTNRTAPISPWLRALARSLAAEDGGTPIGVLGVCIGGSVALSVAIEDVVRAVVISEPCAPLAFVAAEKRDINVSPSDRIRVAERIAAGELAAMGLRFSEDWFVPPDRFGGYRSIFGERFSSIELSSNRRRRTKFSHWEHLVLTFDRQHHSHSPGNVAALEAARAQVVAFLHDQLR